ncbi:hypothetical protein JMJ77_0011822 [Colletotrichum scovillei]|uniref:Uncharacterized protein n=1 Tax=Colletotrichum scovillei TaxID=1209932 RepID=A0A9P7QVM1_9PEZI|nr:hypothetical protein JMJ77_0011822 [Colletotrichum scovillei]KAG7046106.1 hypothetical protein JMJ78_0011174 [Colletotrichum scovillei]KAG7063452.1 hypothetical protein JMJ76_0005917 [Colletotrichum scovillei]
MFSGKVSESENCQTRKKVTREKVVMRANTEAREPHVGNARRMV